MDDPRTSAEIMKDPAYIAQSDQWRARFRALMAHMRPGLNGHLPVIGDMFASMLYGPNLGGMVYSTWHADWCRLRDDQFDSIVIVAGVATIVAPIPDSDLVEFAADFCCPRPLALLRAARAGATNDDLAGWDVVTNVEAAGNRCLFWVCATGAAALYGMGWRPATFARMCNGLWQPAPG